MFIAIIDENSAAPASISFVEHHHTSLTKDYIK